MDPNISLVIGAVALPAFGAAVLGIAHLVFKTTLYDTPIAWVVAVAFAVIVVSLNFFPQYAPGVVAAVTMIYTLLTALLKLIPDTATALFGSPEAKAKLASK